MNEITRMLRRSLPFLPDPDEVYRLFRSKTRTRVLFYLMKYSPASAALIGKALRLKCSSVHREVQWLRRMGYVEERGTIRNGRYGHVDGRAYGLAKPAVLWGIKWVEDSEG